MAVNTSGSNFENIPVEMNTMDTVPGFGWGDVNQLDLTMPPPQTSAENVEMRRIPDPRSVPKKLLAVNVRKPSAAMVNQPSTPTGQLAGTPVITNKVGTVNKKYIY